MAGRGGNRLPELSDVHARRGTHGDLSHDGPLGKLKRRLLEGRAPFPARVLPRRKEVNLVEGDHAGHGLLGERRQQFAVLVGHAAGGVHHQHGHVAAAQLVAGPTRC